MVLCLLCFSPLRSLFPCYMFAFVVLISLFVCVVFVVLAQQQQQTQDLGRDSGQDARAPLIDYVIRCCCVAFVVCSVV